MSKPRNSRRVSQTDADSLPDLFRYFGNHGEGSDAFDVYRHLRDDSSPPTKNARRYVRKLWRRFNELGLPDRVFVNNFPQECPQRIWEMHLAYVFDRWGYKLIPAPKKGKGPDFGIVMANGATMWVEATAPTAGSGANTARFYDIGQGLQASHGDHLPRTQSLRVLQVLDEKSRQRERWRKKQLISEQDGLLLAISGSRWDTHSDPSGVPAFVRCLIGLGRERFQVSLGTRRVRRTWGPGGVVRKEKPDGCDEQVPAAPFMRGLYPEFSAVLFCPNHVKNRPRLPGADFDLLHNPSANVPWPFQAIKRGREFFLRLDVARASGKRAG